MVSFAVNQYLGVFSSDLPTVEESFYGLPDRCRSRCSQPGTSFILVALSAGTEDTRRGTRVEPDFQEVLRERWTHRTRTQQIKGTALNAVGIACHYWSSLATHAWELSPGLP